MTAGLVLTGASPHNQEIDWASLNWRKLEGNVRRLQTRIVQAIQAGRWGKVKALQRLLTRSFSAKALAGWTGKPGRPPARKQRPSGRCKVGAIELSLANGFTSPNRAAANKGSWVFPR